MYVGLAILNGPLVVTHPLVLPFLGLGLLIALTICIMLMANASFMAPGTIPLALFVILAVRCLSLYIYIRCI